MTFKAGTRAAKRAAQKGAVVRWERHRARLKAKQEPEPYGAPFLTFCEAIGHGGPSRAVWRVFWKAVDGLPLDPEELAIFQRHTGRTNPPTAPARECWVPAGRRGGKSENMIARATWRAISRDWRKVLAPGELGTVPLIASDKEQARNSLNYLKGLAKLPTVAPYVVRVLSSAVEFVTGAVVRVVTASWKSTRGFTFLDVILEESAFFSVEGTANPDAEILRAVRPALLTIEDARLYSISSPYARRGILWAAYKAHWGQESPVLIFNADSLSLNPTLNADAIAGAFADDPQAAASEYGREGLVQFRSDVERFLSAEALDAVTVEGRRELAPVSGVGYRAFVDPSGGSQDAMTLAVAHAERRDGQTVAVLDCLRERRPPFSPEAVVLEFAEVLKSYGLARVRGDRYAGEWPRERFSKAGITYEVAPLPKSDMYKGLLPAVNSGRVELLEHRVLRAQLESLERRTARGGRDSVDHPPGGQQDDTANAAAGALTMALESGVTDWSGMAAALVELNDGLAAPSYYGPKTPRWRD